jgi:hypothetical protein
VVAHGVVQAARDVRGVQRLPRPDLAERLEAGADDVGGRLVHAEEDGVVVAAEADLELGQAGVTGPLHRFDEGGVMDGRDLVERRLGRRDHPEPAAGHLELMGQLHGELDPDRGHRVVRTEVVVGERRVEDHGARPGALHAVDAIVGVC